MTSTHDTDTTTGGKGPATDGSRGPADGLPIDGESEAAGGAAVLDPGDGPAPGEEADRADPAGPVGPTVVDPAARDRGGAERVASTPVMLGSIKRMVSVTLVSGERSDGEEVRREVRVPEGTTILGALHAEGTPEQADTPTLCWAPNMDPINACRVCVVEVEGARTLVPSCARTCEDGMAVKTDTEKVRHSRRMVLELLTSSVDMSQASDDVQRWTREYGVDAERYGPPAPLSA